MECKKGVRHARMPPDENMVTLFFIPTKKGYHSHVLLSRKRVDKKSRKSITNANKNQFLICLFFFLETQQIILLIKNVNKEPSNF